MTESGKPLQCWIKDDKLLLVMSRRMLIYDYNDLEGKNQEIKLKEELIPQISFATCASLAAKANSAGELNFWLGMVGPRRRVAQLYKAEQKTRKIPGSVFAAYGSYACRIVWNTKAKDGESPLRLDSQDAIIIDNEYILSMTVYLPDCLAITCEKQEKIFNCVEGKEY